MPRVTFTGPVDPADGTQAVEIDEITLRVGGDAEELTEAQLERVRDIPGLQFEVDGETVQTEPPARGPADAAAPVPDVGFGPLEGRTVDQLQQLARANGVEGFSERNKDDLVELLEEHGLGEDE